MSIPAQWRAYLRVQTDLLSRACVDDTAWGLEAGLDRLLQGDADDGEISRTVRSRARQQRHRARARRISAAVFDRDHREDGRYDARDALAAARAMTPAGNWDLLVTLGAGASFSQVAAEAGTSEGGLRVRVHRIRCDLRAALQGYENAREAA